MALNLYDKIDFFVDGEIKSIELWRGDITCLPIEQKADLLIISAFHGEWAVVVIV